MINKLRETMKMLACIEQNFMDIANDEDIEVHNIIEHFNTALENQRRTIRVAWRDLID